jgi:EF-P beta-lysylation protein EpmB
MTPATPAIEKVPQPGPGWQQAMADAYTDPQALLADLGLDQQLSGILNPQPGKFPLRVPRAFVRRMQFGDPQDPLLRQVLPLDAENRIVAGFSADPVGDLPSLQAPGLLKKYRGRALLIATGACAVHCRYCFRREFPYAAHSALGNNLDLSLAEIASDPGIREVILSGGDPLSLGDARLGRLLSQLDELPQLRRIRLHTRLPIVLPERITAKLLDQLSKLNRQVVIVVHSNHAQELDASVAGAMQALRDSGALLLNQSVLLRGVNDSVEALVNLSERLFACGVLPYYLHQLDPVAGAAHFEVSDTVAAQLIGAAAAELPGYILPRLVRERPGSPAKEPIAFELAVR